MGKIGEELEKQVFHSDNYENKIKQTPLTDGKLKRLVKEINEEIKPYLGEYSLKIGVNMAPYGYTLFDKIGEYIPHLNFEVTDLPGKITINNGKKIFTGNVMEVDPKGTVYINRKLNRVPKNALKRNIIGPLYNENGHIILKRKYNIPFLYQKRRDIETVLDFQASSMIKKQYGPKISNHWMERSLYIHH
jgi:hypothetical protein